MWEKKTAATEDVGKGMKARLKGISSEEKNGNGVMVCVAVMLSLTFWIIFERGGTVLALNSIMESIT
ncbi:hypothetical protein RIF29_20292 [Crotalaria pallida]|uniref:Uncharacterized protein n=1 Tax=Crotalaria pallida TaxID=3830 RepID=A0AAN9F0Y9_CROPI